MAQSKASGAARPLSPHLQIWKWHVTMATSILHRATGVGNAAGLLLVTVWLVAAAMGPEAYAFFQSLMSTMIGQLVLIGFTASLSYHLLNGVRHLAWDMGEGFGLVTSRVSGVFVFIGTVLLTAGIWFAASLAQGGAV